MIKKRLIRLMGKEKKWIFLNVFSQWLSLLASIAMIWSISGYFGGLFDGLKPNILPVIGLILLMAVIKGICASLSTRFSYKASRGVKQTLRRKIYEKIMRLGASYTEKIPTAEVVQLCGEGVEQLEIYYGAYLAQFFYSLLAPVTLFAVLAPVNLTAALVLLICVPLIPVSIVIVQKIAKRILSKYWGQYTKLADSFLENLQGLTTLKIYQTDMLRHRKMNEEAEHFRKVTMKVLTMQLNSIIVMDTVAYAGAALGILFAVFAFQQGTVSFSGALMIVLLSAEFFLPMRALGSLFHVAMNGMTASDKMFDLFDLPEEEKGTEEFCPADAIVLESVDFAYQPERPILEGISLAIEPGSFTAIAGVSGSGKSTLASLIHQRQTPTGGSIRNGKTDLKDIRPSSLYENVCYIGHQSTLFKGTVRENLMMADEGMNEARMLEVLDQVKLSGFLDSLEGLDTRLTEGAANLSGGQRQRLALARAILHDAKVYIFDEATSNIDVESEEMILEQIQKMCGKKTVIMISHRLANTVLADRIYLIEDGKIHEEGSHQDLLRQNGSYANLYREQKRLEQFESEEAA